MTKQIKLKGIEVGSTHKTNNCGDIEILDIIDSRNVLVRFKRTNTEDRVYIKENKRFSFLKSRFKLLEE